MFRGMKLDEKQRQQVAAWIEEGLKLSDIQNRLEKEMGLRMTYLDVRFLVDDLKLQPKDPPEPAPQKTVAPEPAPVEAESPEVALAEEPLPTGGNVSVSVDQVARPGAMISGKVTFSDGKNAEWFLDQTGRLGVTAAEKGYKPSPADVQAFQMELQRQLQKLGYV